MAVNAADVAASPERTNRSWAPPAAITPRGTVVLLPGRGEHAGVYERFGLRLSADGYLVTALATSPESTEEAAHRLAELVADDPPVPIVLIGSDIGALHALTLGGSTAVVAAGAPLADGPLSGDTATQWSAELAARTACPTHRARLTDDRDLRRGAVLTEPVPAELIDRAAAARPTIPVLFVHGATDPLAPLEPVRKLAANLPNASVAIVRDGRHDALNDINHRTVAAEIVQFLERVRATPTATPILTVE